MTSTLSLADQAKVAAMAPPSPEPTPADAAPADVVAAKARAAKDRKNAAARAKRLNKAAAALPDAAPAPKAKPAPKVKATPKAKPAPKVAPVGGAREGAGRKPLYKEAMNKAVTVKLTERQFKAFHSVAEGGTAWLRRGLDEMMAAKRK